MLGGAGSPGGDDLLTVTVVRDEHGYGMKVSGDNPVYVQSVKEHGAAWRAGLRAGDRILRVDSVPVHHHTHQQVVHMIRANPTTVLTVQQNSSRHKTPITAPVPVNSEKQRQLEVSKVHTVRLMLEKEQKFIRDLRNELLKVPDVRKQTQLESAEQRCSKLQHEIDTIMAGQPPDAAPTTPRQPRSTPTPNTGFLSGLPRSLSNLTGQSLRNLRQARTNKIQQENTPPLVRQNSDESNNKRRHVHNNTVPMVPTTCLDNVTPPPLPPRSIERPKRNPLSPNLSPPPINPLAKPKPSNSTASPSHKQYYKGRYYPDKFMMHQSVPAYDPKQLRRSSHSLDGELEGPQPNSIAMQMSYPLVNVPPPPLQTDNRTGVPVLHMRSRSSPEQLDHDLNRSSIGPSPLIGATSLTPAGVCPPLPPPAAPCAHKQCCDRDTPPPGTPPPPYHTNTQPCADPQRAIISMEEDDSPASDTSTYSGLFSNLRSVRESKARTAVLLNWLLGERRCACACLLLVLTDGYRSASAVHTHTLRRWAYEIHSTFLVPNAVLQLSGVDENMANEIEHVLVNEFDKEELLRNVFRKARQKAKDELSQQLTEFQVKRQVGLGTLYGPEDSVIDKCDVDKAQELIVVEQLMCGQLRSACRAGAGACGAGACGAGPHAAPQHDTHATLMAALIAAALCLHCRPASVAAAVGGSRASFLQRDKLYKQRVKQINKQHPQPFVVRGHHLQLQELTSVAHCHHCDNIIWGLAPQAYVCTDCKLRVHRTCARSVEEGCCLDGEHHNNRISRFMERIHANNQPMNLDSNDKKFRKASGPAHFLNMERSFRKAEDDPPWDQTLTPVIERRDESDESLYESADGHSDAISASDDALPRLGKTPTISKESLKLAVTDEEVDFTKSKKGHRKTMSLSNPLEIVRNLGDEWFESAKRELEKNSDKKKSRESLWSEEDRDSIHGSTMKLDQLRKNSKKEDKNQANLRKTSTNEAPKTRKTSKGSSVSALNFLRRKKTPTSTKPVESVAEDDKGISTDEIMNYTKLFLECERRFASISEARLIRPVETDSEDEPPTPKQLADHRRRLSRQTSRSKSKVRGKSQSLKINTLRKSHSGTLKKGKKKSVKTPSSGRSRQASIVEQTPIAKKKHTDSSKQNSWLFSGSRGESRREGSTDEPTAPDADVDTSDANTKEPDKDNNWRSPAPGGRGVNRAESCRERDAPRRGKHRNASDPNRLTAHNNHDLEPGAATAPSGSSSSSSLSSRSNESNTVAAEQQASQSDWSEEEEPLAAQWADSLPPHALDSLDLSATLRKRQEVIHELIVSEGSHVRWLRVLGGVFLRPLERHAHLLAGDELRSLFPNLPAVRERHSRLYSDLRTARNEAGNHVVQIRPVADALLNTLGDSGYSSCVSKFCRGQRMALDALRERRRKSKDLHQFLAAREQQPLCGRLQLKDMLACVWQRLTKYQLLLEGILKTVTEGEETEEDVARLKRAHDVAKDVLHKVDTAIRTAENEHRLKTIQSKLEVRASAEWEELRRLDLTHHTLRNEGELTLRNDSTKRINVLALMLEDSLVLLQRESDKFVLKPIPQPSQQQSFLSPLIKWDKVLFRPNAAVRNTFFLMNINGVQMHELSANTTPEYTSWVKHIQEAPLAKLTELKSTITPAHAHSRSADDSGVNVSRNPSDASEKSSSTAPDEPVEPEKERVSVDRSSVETDEKRVTVEEDKRSVERESSADKEAEVKEDKEDKHKPRRPTVGRISTHGASPCALESPRAILVHAPAAHNARTAQRAFTDQERLRRLDDVISRALRAKSSIVGSVLGVPPHSYAHFADLAVADALGEVDVCGELSLSRSSSHDDVPGAPHDVPAGHAGDIHQLLLAAHAQATQLTRSLQRALNVSEAETVAARARSGRCDSCRRSHQHEHEHEHEHESAELVACSEELLQLAPSSSPCTSSLERDVADALADLQPAHMEAGGERESADDALESSGSAAALAARLVPLSCGLQATLARAVTSLASARPERAREELLLLREQNDRLRARTSTDQHTTEEISVPKASLDPSIQEQPSNGG